MGNQLAIASHASELALKLGLGFIGADVEFDRVEPLSCVGDGAMCFAKGPLDWSSGPRAVAIAPEGSKVGQGAIIVSPTPRLSFAKALCLLDAQPGFIAADLPPDVHPTARVSPTAMLGRGVRIGARTVVNHFVVIADGVSVGEDCYIKSGAVVGEEGFGFERDGDGTPVRLVHLGGVRIGNRVEIGSLTTVCRGTLGDTLIDDDAKIDDHVHIAHNCLIRKGAMVVACAEVSGGVELSEYSWIGPNASIIQQMKIGAGAVVGIGANVIRPVESGAVVAGNPARRLTPRTG